jgi:DNA-binding CsgD family transcriptional regulator
MIDMRSIYPKPSGKLTDRQIEILRLLANGFTGEEIADVLHLSHVTVENCKSEIYAALNVRNGYEAIRVALCLGIIKQEELIFFGRNYVLRPKPDKNEKRKKREMRNEEDLC